MKLKNLRDIVLLYYYVKFQISMITYKYKINVLCACCSHSVIFFCIAGHIFGTNKNNLTKKEKPWAYYAKHKGRYKRILITKELTNKKMYKDWQCKGGR